MKYSLHLALLAVVGGAASLPAHEHLAVGADGNGRLLLYNGAGQPIVAPNLPAIYHLCPRPAPQTFGGYYSISDEDPRELYPNDSFAFIAYSDGQVEADGPHHAATGANIWCEVTSVTGPAGGHVGFWDNSQEYYSLTPNIAFAANAPTGGWKFAVGEPVPQPDAPSGALAESANGYYYIVPASVTTLKVDAGMDPFGHIHSRGFTADMPGDYYVGFTFRDLGGNGPGGGPLNASSPTYVFHFRAGPDFTPVQTFSGLDAVLAWPSLMGVAAGQDGIVFTIERTTDLTNAAAWKTLGAVTGTTAPVASFTDPGARSLGRCFYRLQYPWAASGK